MADRRWRPRRPARGSCHESPPRMGVGAVDLADARSQAVDPAAGWARDYGGLATATAATTGHWRRIRPRDGHGGPRSVDGGRGGDGDGDGCGSGGGIVRDRRRPLSLPGSPPSGRREAAAVASVAATAASVAATVARSPAMTTC
uniref:Uncharacterized protein n=1 Tax=Oryza glumipatula TaxID=40148 RepID=A0A0E0BAS5_9ORYZ